jgi:predicted alpha-1,2-mannosidase
MVFSFFRVLPFLIILIATACTNSDSKKSVVDYVDPFIGTGGHGHTYPGAVLPFGMVQLSPDNGTQGWDWCSGYHYSDSNIVGFSHTALSGTGIGDLLDISMMPSVGKNFDTLLTPSRFSHDDETATPGYYAVRLKDYDIYSELTVSKHIGWQRHTFPEAENAMLRIDLGWAINWDKATDTYVRRLDDSTLVGYRFSTGWAKGQKVFFALRSQKLKEAELSLLADKQAVAGDSAKGEKVVAGLKFSTKKGEQVIFKTGISFATIEGAVAAVDARPDYAFDAVRKDARNEWENELSQIQLVAEDSVKRIFYTAMYHCYLAPSLYSDIKGQNKGTDSLVKTADHPVYTVQSLWDTFRAANPWFTLMQPDRVSDIIKSYLLFYDQNGLLPVWDLHFWETNTMTGYHAIPIVADAILKDIGGFDYEKAYTAMKASAMQNIRGTEHYRKLGYVPQDKHGWSVTITLEYAFDDWCIAQVAKKLGKEDDYALFSKRAESYRNLYDPATRFFRAKNSDGNWVEPFDPMRSEHGFDGLYIEGTAWQHTFFVPHAVKGYAELMGGKGALIAKLDSLFTNNQPMTGEDISPDISGFIGQYAHGNEPSHHIAYMYAALGAPEKGARRIREIMTTLYTKNPDGLSGNEDCGQMSAWFLWSALGMYPMNPASGEYFIGSPIIRRALINLKNGNKIEILVNNQKPENAIVQSAKWNGVLLDQFKISHEELIKGGKLEFTMTH